MAKALSLSGQPRSWGLLLGSLALLAGCATTKLQPETRVWSSSSSNDGFANCPMGTTVVGGGHEIAEALQAPGHLPHVVASQPYGNGWRVMCTDDKGSPTGGCKAWVVCASVLR
jgi:hypothetical protein